MSKIEVDAITQQSGTTLTVGGGASKTVVADATTVTLGRCGGTVALASGASQTGFGRTGTVDWQTTPKTATFTAVSGEGYFANTTGSAFNMNLPAGVAGAIVSVADYAETFQTNNLTIVPNGTDKIGSLNENAKLDTKGQSVTFVFVDSTQGWINTMDSTSNVRGISNFIVATVSGSGNTLSTAPDCANMKIATFTGPGTFCVSQGGTACGSNTVDYLVVAGGGGGGVGCGGGGGAGGGGMRFSFPNPATGGLPVSAQAYPITVGAGGTKGDGSVSPTPGPSGRCGSQGASSIFSSITSAGGGLGGAGSYSRPGGNGGSGGGGGRAGSAGSGNTPPVSPSQGNNGGAGSGGPGGNYGGGAGGGHNAVGAGGSGNSGGNGGAGSALTITGASVTYAGGGGGGAFPAPTSQSTGGAGGGGRGAPASLPLADMDGTVNTGGGGGGGSEGPAYGPIVGPPADSPGGTGGSGIVIIRYKFQ
jgi:hypothetical protein